MSYECVFFTEEFLAFGIPVAQVCRGKLRQGEKLVNSYPLSCLLSVNFLFALKRCLFVLVLTVKTIVICGRGFFINSQ